MSTIEPTEEQREAALRFCKDHSSVCGNGWLVDEFTVAELLAEREAKLHKQLAFMEAGSLADYNAFAEALQKEDAYLAEINLINERLAEMREVDGRKSRMLYDRDVVIDTLRARVAELEASRDHPRTWAAVEAREAQHLADIRALMGCCRGLVHDVDRLMCGIDVGRHAMVMRATLQRLAHYDDAKAEEPAVDWQAWANGSCPEPGCSLANPHEQGVACVKPTAEGRCAMSEPVIRPWSYKCFAGCEDVEANHLDGIDPRSVHHHSVDPLYTRDDLVRVARESRESVWVKFSGDEDATVVFEETSADLVDRLTKGKT